MNATPTRSWIEYTSDTHFPIQNLPFGVYSSLATPTPNVCIAIGDYLIDLAILDEAGFLSGLAVAGKELFHDPTLNHIMSESKEDVRALRHHLMELLDVSNGALRDNATLRQHAVMPQSAVQMHLPVEIGDYTDFYSSREHATNVGTMFRGKENALMPNWLHLPVAYHGRASSVVVSGTPIHRPAGQVLPPDAQEPIFSPCRLLDYELEMGFFVRKPNEMGSPISVDNAEEHIFGMVLVNDWSARDIQKWEYQPLGPFLAKNFGTTISPWVVTLDALEPFRCNGPKQDPTPLPYLASKGPGSFDITLEASLQCEDSNAEPLSICETNFKHMYWDIRQQLAHHTITGCNVRTGDLMASGTISGSTEESYGSLLERTWKGTKPLQLSNGEERKFLQDGDTLTLTGYCQGEDYRIGFGTAVGTVKPCHVAHQASLC